MQTKYSFLDKGQIVQQGSHNQLINQDGYYKELYIAQLAAKKANNFLDDFIFFFIFDWQLSHPKKYLRDYE